MDGETQLRALELKERTIGVQGKTLPEKERQLLLRARQIEKSGDIFSEERPNQILEAAYQRAIARGDDISDDSYASPEDTERASRRNLRSTTGYTGVKRKPPAKTGRVDRNYPSSQGSYPDSSTSEPSTGQYGDQTTSDIISIAEEGAMVAEQLAIEQGWNEVNNQISDVYQEGKSYGKPSKFKYFILFLLAIVVDLLNLLTLSGFGYVVSVLVSIIITIIMYLIFWFSNGKQKSADHYQKKVIDFTQNLQKNVAHLERRTIQITRLTGKFTGSRVIKRLKPVKALRKGTAAVLKITRRNPATKFLGAAIANMIPLLDLLPWQILGVYLSYRDERETYTDASDVADDLLEEAPTQE